MSDLFVSTAARSSSRRRAARAGLAAALVLLAAAAGLAGVALAERGTIPSRTAIAGVDVGGKAREEAHAAVAEAARAAMSRPIRLLGAGAGEERTSGSELGARPLLEQALDAALDAGPLDRLLRRAGIGDTRRIELSYRLGPVRAAELANRLDRRFGAPARDARVVVGAHGTSVEPALAGRRVDRAALRAGLRTLPAVFEIPLEVDPPAVDAEAALRAKRAVDRLLDGPRAVRFGAVEAPLPVARLRALVTTTPRGGALAVELDPAGLRAALLPRLRRFERPARDAGFAVEGTRVRLVPSLPGRTLDTRRIAASLVTNLDSVVHRARFRNSQPALTTAAARKLRITELVSEFTTSYSCCQPRVTNIKRAAALLDGTIIRPGEEFSLNEALGERTEEKGFVSAPQIYDGRLEDAVGGGISQVATTLYNAAFFAGVDLVAHRAHQFYISRYPMGREATVSWGGPELIFRNDWPAAILMKLDAGDTGITVRFYSTKLGRRVETTTGEPYAVTPPRTITVENRALPAGARNVLQEAGGSGFTVRYTRQVFRGDRLIRDETYTVRYDPKNAFVEVGPPKPRKPPRANGPPSARSGGGDPAPPAGGSAPAAAARS